MSGMFFETHCTYDLHHNFGRFSTVKKFNPQLIFHNLNTGSLKHSLKSGSDASSLIARSQRSPGHKLLLGFEPRKYVEYFWLENVKTKYECLES